MPRLRCFGTSSSGACDTVSGLWRLRHGAWDIVSELWFLNSLTMVPRLRLNCGFLAVVPGLVVAWPVMPRMYYLGCGALFVSSGLWCLGYGAWAVAPGRTAGARNELWTPWAVIAKAVATWGYPVNLATLVLASTMTTRWRWWWRGRWWRHAGRSPLCLRHPSWKLLEAHVAL